MQNISINDITLFKDENNLIPMDDNMAILTHYYHLQGSRHGTAYKKKALDIVLQKHHETVINNCVEPSAQYGFFQNEFDFPFPPVRKPKFTFIDLFAGIGGFRLAMQNLGGKCVYSSEIDEAAKRTYFINYGEVPFGDITLDSTKSYIPDNFDVLCAGFPCQAFSKAGKQAGLNDTRGTLFFEVQEILKTKRPKYLFLENVRNIVSHDHGNTWKIINENIRSLGYRIPKEPIILSPHQYGIPQFRERVYIIGVFDPDHSSEDLCVPLGNLLGKDDNSIDTILEENSVDSKFNISIQEKKVLTAWNEFYQGINQKVIGYPIWSAYFKSSPSELSKHPRWKQDFIQKNISLYKTNKSFIDKWLKKWNNLEDFTPTQKKFEWQAGISISSLWEGVIQLRPSGVRVKKPNFFPALVAIVQIPIVGKRKRHLSIRECARLQSFPDEFKPCTTDQLALKQLGNSVNVNIIEKLAAQLITI